MPRRYAFLVQVAYSIEILRPLQQAIRARGDEVVWYLHQVDGSLLHEDEQRCDTVDEVRAYAPEAVFVPGNWAPSFFPGIKVEIFHGLANDETGKKGHYRIRGLFDLYCTHAPDVTRTFQRLAQQHGHFQVAETGWPKLDPLYQGKVPGPREPDQADPRSVILYASTFSPSLTSAPALLETIKTLSRTGRWRWLVTLHPKMAPEVVSDYRQLEGPNLEFVASTSGVIRLIQRADVMLCDTSSIMLEFMLLRRPVVTYRTKVPGPHVHNVTDLNEIEISLEHALTRPPEQLVAAQQLLNQLHAYTDGASSQRVLEASDAFISNPGKLKKKPLNLWRKLQMRMRMGYWKY